MERAQGPSNKVFMNQRKQNALLAWDHKGDFFIYQECDFKHTTPANCPKDCLGKPSSTLTFNLQCKMGHCFNQILSFRSALMENSSKCFLDNSKLVFLGGFHSTCLAKLLSIHSGWVC